MNDEDDDDKDLTIEVFASVQKDREITQFRAVRTNEQLGDPAEVLLAMALSEAIQSLTPILSRPVSVLAEAIDYWALFDDERFPPGSPEAVFHDAAVKLLDHYRRCDGERAAEAEADAADEEEDEDEEEDD